MQIKKIQIHIQSLKDEAELPDKKTTEPVVVASQARCKSNCSCDICQIWFDVGGEA